MEYEFEVLKPEEDVWFVPGPQMTRYQTRNGHLKVIIYFMANTAVEITSGIATSAMGKVKLQYRAESPSGAYTASQTLRKVAFTFTSPQGMASTIEFHGEKSYPAKSTRNSSRG